MSVHVGARNATYEDMYALLEAQHAAKVDVVAPAAALLSRYGAIELSGVKPVMDERGVTQVDGLYVPTAKADAMIARNLRIPTKYLRLLREERPDLYDANVNGWLGGTAQPGAADARKAAADDRSFLLRLFTDPNGGHGVMRAMLSDSYGIVDHLDVLTAVLLGVREADAEISIRSCDVSESSMHCKVYSPSVAKLAPYFLKGYRNPFADPELEAARRDVTTQVENTRALADAEGMGYEPGEEPIVFAGFRFSNSEIGAGAVTITPELYVKICRNGLTLPLLAWRKFHSGSRMDAGAVDWSRDTQNKRLAVITAETRDAVRKWLSPTFLEAQIGKLEEQAGAPVKKPDETIKVVAKELGFTEAERAGVLSHFIAGAQLTAGGIANAITSFSQTVADGDRADELDDVAIKAMAYVA